MSNIFWDKGRPGEKYPALNENIETDVCIIGGGLAGVMCADELSDRGYSVCVLEADRVGLGQTSGSSGMVSFAHDLIYARLIKKHGKTTAKKYLELNKKGMEKIRRKIDGYKIDCGFNACAMYLFATTKKGVKNLRKEQDAYRELGVKTAFTTETELPFPATALKIEGQAYIDPLAFVRGVCRGAAKKGVRIFENTRVIHQPENGELRCGEHIVRAKHFVVAAHFPFFDFPGFYFAKIYQSRSHNIVFSTKHKIRNIYESAEDNGFEYRPVQDGFLCGGANIRTGSYKHKSQYEIVENNIKKNFGSINDGIISRFSAQDCMTFDMLPYAGRYSNFLDNVYLITGFNKWGFTNSAAAAEIIANLIENNNNVESASGSNEKNGGKVIIDTGEKSTGENIFDTKRLYILKSPLKAAKNTGKLVQSFANLIINADAKKLSCIRPGQGAIVKIKGKRLGVYNDNGKYKAISAVCPHLGCNLKWNKDELSWDCPCHGSRFDTDGNILSNPACDKADAVKIHDKF